jgi:hypothetical protein
MMPQPDRGYSLVSQLDTWLTIWLWQVVVEVATAAVVVVVQVDY